MKLTRSHLSMRCVARFRAGSRAALLAFFAGMIIPLAKAQTASSNGTTDASTPPATQTAPAKKDKAASAQSDTSARDKNKKLDEIVVVATRTPQEKSKTAASVSVYSAQDITNGNIESPQELLRYDVGVSASRSVGGGGMTLNTATGVEDYNIRGLDENRVLLIEDGIRAPDIFSFQGNAADGRDFYDFDSLKSVQIIKSAASALYGGGAIGGVVSYETKDPADFLAQTNNPYYFSLKESFASADLSFSETGTFAARSGPVDYLVLYTRRDGQQQDISANTSIDGPAGANPLSYGQNNALAKVVYHLDAQNQIRLTGEYFDYNDSTDLKSATYTSFNLGPPFGVVPLFTGMHTEDNDNRYRASLDYQFTGKSDDLFKNIQATAYYQETDSKQHIVEDQGLGVFFPDPDVATLDESYKTTILGANFQMTHDSEAYGFGNEWTYGGDLSYSTQNRYTNGLAVNSVTGATFPGDGTETFPREDIPPSYTTRLGSFFQDQIKPTEASWLTLTPAVRFDYYNLAVSNSPAYLNASNGVAGVPYQKFSATPSFSALAQVTKELVVYGNFAEGFRNPNTEDLNATFTNPGSFYEVIPNPTLKSEQSYDFETGVRGNYDPIKFSLAGFYNIYNDFINDQAATTLVDPNNPGFAVFQSQNIPRARIYGLEGGFEVPLGYYSSSLEGLKILNSWAWTVGTDETNHQPLTTVDPFKVVNILRYEAPGRKWTVDLVGTWVASQTRQPNDITINFVPPAYYTLDLVGRYHITENALFTLGVYNLTNQTYWLYQTTSMPEVASTFDAGGVARFSEPGINVRAGITVHF